MMRAYALYTYAVAAAFAVTGLYILVAGRRRLKPLPRLAGAGLVVLSVVIWRTAHQPWHWRWA
jgi:hypothetical protein